MIIARVLGSVVSTVHHPIYDGRKLLVIQPEMPDGKPKGDSLLALDFVHAGPGDRVLVIVEGSSTRTLVEDDSAPVHAAIVGIIDEVDVKENL
ncbi:MAG: EutN/CcmL family microcompartment protein [Planctomycetota bacterium]